MQLQGACVGRSINVASYSQQGHGVEGVNAER